MAPENGAISAGRKMAAAAGCGGGGPPEEEQGMKKGPWTSTEDVILVDYVKKHGEGNWNAIQKRSGLKRCGKSCRLRWVNHLRPNLKKGAFTPEEESLIIDLHSQFGNKWARMALHLPGRTDNEIKNFWNTRLKRLQRAGLPVYSLDFHQRHHHRRRHEQPPQSQIVPSSSSSSSLHKVNAPLDSISTMSLLDPLNYPVLNACLNSQSHIKPFCDNINGGVDLSQSSSSNLQFDSSPSFIPQLNHYSMNPIQTSSINVKAHENVHNEITPTASSNTINDQIIVPSSDGDDYEIAPCSWENGGLLQDVLEQSRALLSNQSCDKEEKQPKDEQIKHNYAVMKNPSDTTNLESTSGLRDNDTKYLEDSSSGHSSIEMGVKPQGEVQFEEINMMDDDFSSWLDFPVSGTLEDWCGGNGDTSPEKQFDVSDGADVALKDNHQEVLCSPVAVATTVAERDQDSSCWWDNMARFS